MIYDRWMEERRLARMREESVAVQRMRRTVERIEHERAKEAAWLSAQREAAEAPIRAERERALAQKRKAYKQMLG
jgi:hypothetical protein